MCLLSLGANAYRSNGGLGFSVADPLFEVSCSPSVNLNILDLRKRGFTDALVPSLTEKLKLVQERLGLRTSATITIEQASPTAHAGFGSGTALTLAAIEALCRINGFSPAPATVLQASGRGGTSGVGVHTYFEGGFVFDLGRKYDGVWGSSEFAATPLSPPLKLLRLQMPEWPIGICIPNVPSVDVKDEQAFFKRVCPLKDEEVAYATYHALFGVCASVMESDWAGFCKAVVALQSSRWKHEERSMYGRDFLNAEESLYTAGAACVGMSSFGPAMFFLSPSIERTIELARIALPGATIFETLPANFGRSFCYD